MNLQSLSDDALRSAIARIGKEMTSASSTRHSAMEKDRMLYIKEAEKRGLLGNMRTKKKYRQS